MGEAIEEGVPLLNIVRTLLILSMLGIPDNQKNLKYQISPDR
jgi:hypothetical protein